MMKKYFAIAIGLLMHFSISAQTYTVTTWYVIPPTSGCNGIWAIDATTWPCFSGTCTYLIPTPFGCTPTIPTCDSIVGDTLYIPLCSLPCNIAASCGSTTMICSITPLTTNIDQIEREEIKTSFSDNILGVENLNQNQIIEIYDISSRRIIQKKHLSTKEEINFNSLSKQIYILVVKDNNNEIVYRKKIAW